MEQERVIRSAGLALCLCLSLGAAMPAGSAIEPGAADLPAPVPATSDDTAAFNAAVEAYAAGDTSRAAVLFADLARAGDPDAQFNLALIYHSGEGVPRNDREALYWAWRARIEGLPAAEPLIRMLTEQGAPGLGPSIAPRLLTDLQDALKAGHGHAMLGAALVMAQLSDPPDPEGAYLWQSLAAALGEPGAASARDETLAALPPESWADLEDRAMKKFGEWCATAIAPPMACKLVK